MKIMTFTHGGKFINYISNIRKKLMTAPDIPNYIKGIHCIGYKFNS